MTGTASVFSNGAVPPSDLWQSSERFCVLDTCFGDGSFFTSLRRSWKAAPGRSRTLHYIAVFGDAHTPPPQYFIQNWPLPLPGHHRILLGEESDVQLTVVFGGPRSPLQTIAATFDLVLLGHEYAQAADLARLSRPGTTLYTRSKTEATLEALRRSGFVLEPETRSLTRGVFRAQNPRTKYATAFSGSRHAIVVGAGLAGTAAAASLAARGWKVTVFEKRSAPANAASGNLAAAISPMLSKDDGIAARLSRACFFALLAELRRLDHSQTPAKWSACGLLQMARSEKESAHFEQVIPHLNYPPQVVRLLNKEEASTQAGCPVPAAGLYFPEGGWVNPPSLCQARLQSPHIHLHNNVNVSAIVFEDGVWRAQNIEGLCLGEAPILVLANAFESALFAQTNRLHFKKVRGQVTHISKRDLPFFNAVISRNGYLTPALEGQCSLGATYDFESDEAGLNAECQQQNLARISTLLNAVNPSLSELTGRVGFRSLTADRLPVIGAVPDYAAANAPTNSKGIARQQGLYALLGLGSRGVVWSTLAGETLAALIEGEPSPLSSDLLEAIDPGRFLKREHRTLSSTPST